jgi:predicted site-specific integrase-resolvase
MLDDRLVQHEKPSKNVSSSTGLRAAQYVRMSTDHQKYSVDNQAETIGAYAARHGLAIVRTYEDAGPSGLRIDRREALKELISDVLLGRADFDFILVYGGADFKMQMKARTMSSFAGKRA